MAKARPWSAYALRLVCSGLMFVSGFLLLTNSTFALRLRGDAPVTALVLALAALLAFLPLALGRRYLGGMMVSAFLLAGIGGYWWTTIPWDELIKESEFGATTRPTILDYALVASPAVVCAFYAAVSRASLLRADLKNRGADADEISRAASASFLAGSALLVVCGGLAVALWTLMASGLVFRAAAPLPTGVPALIIVGALLTVAYALFAKRVPAPRFRKATVPAVGVVAAAKPTSLVARVKAISFRSILSR